MVLSLVDRFVSDRETVLRVAAAGFTLALAAATTWFARRWWLVLPMLLSLYVVSSGVYLLPENAAWLLVAVVLGLCLDRQPNRAFYVAAAAALAGLVFVRQTHAWAGLPIVVAALYGTRRDAWVKTAAAAAGAVMPAVLVLGLFVWLWGGLTPPLYHPDAPDAPENLGTIRYGGFTLVPVGFTFVLIGVYGLFFTPCLWGRRINWPWPVIGGAVALVFALAVPSTILHPMRDYAFWPLMNKLPAIAERSIAFVSLATLGGAVAGAIASVLPSRDRAVMGAALAGFILAHLPNPMVWQRYYEPFVLMWLAYACGRLTEPASGPGRSLSRAMPLILAAVLFGITSVSLKLL